MTETSDRGGMKRKKKEGYASSEKKQLACEKLGEIMILENLED